MSGNDATASDAVDLEPDDGGCSHVGTESVDADVRIVRSRKRENGRAYKPSNQSGAVESAVDSKSAHAPETTRLDLSAIASSA